MAIEQTNKAGIVTVAPTASASITSGVSQASAAKIPPNVLDKLQKQKFNTNDIISPWFRCILYGDIDVGKTVTAARFDTPEKVRIIMTRQKEQTLSLQGENYQCFHAENSEMLRYVMLYPEVIWPEWAKIPDKTLVLDDITQAADMAVDDNDSPDTRKSFKGAKDDLRELIQLGVLRKPMNFIMVALERSTEIGAEIRIGPNLSPSIASMMNADFEFVFNLVPGRNVLTTSNRQAFIKKDENNKDKTFSLVRFARHKIPVSMQNKGLIKPAEPADLRLIWERVRMR